MTTETGARLLAAGGSIITPPQKEKFSYYYKFDEIKCYLANDGRSHKVSEIKPVHATDLFEIEDEMPEP